MLIGWSDPTPDDPAKQYFLPLDGFGWSGPRPDDPDLGISEAIFVHKKSVGSDDPVLGRIIQTWGERRRARGENRPPNPQPF